MGARFDEGVQSKPFRKAHAPRSAIWLPRRRSGSCRTGVCHTCETGLVAGTVGYRPDPVDAPADGNVLICCSHPQGDIAIDL
jgi:hypothetical protein